MSGNNARRAAIVNALNKAVDVFSSSSENIDAVISSGLSPVADAAGLHRISFYRIISGTYSLGQIYLWDFGKTVKTNFESVVVPDNPAILHWFKLLTEGECITGRLDEMARDEKDFLGMYGVRSIFFVPVFMYKKFWGLVTLEDRINYRYFDSECLDLLSLAARLCASKYIEMEMLTSAKKALVALKHREKLHSKMKENTAAANAKLKDALQKANAASRAKSEFLSNMSHEMRTPLNAVIGMALIGKSAEDIPRKDYALGKIEEASAHLLNVINDILDMAKIEANKVKLAPLTFNFHKMLQKVITVSCFRIREKDLVFKAYVDEKIPKTVFADEHRLIQVITNLLGNAVKFTSPGGSISLDVRFLDLEPPDEESGICNIQLSVSDTGIGMSAEQQERLFQSFEQAENSTSRKYGGTGLGLSISKKIVEMMGGEIWSHSELGKGSTFSFKVPLEKDEGKKAPESKKDEPDLKGIFSGHCILLAEDIEINRDIVLSLLEPTLLKIDCAVNGSEAVRMFTEAPEKYSLILMDIQMPEMDGYEATRKIRVFESGRPKGVPIIAMTANVFREDVEKCLEAGMNGHIKKPVDFNEILASLCRYLLQKDP